MKNFLITSLAALALASATPAQNAPNSPGAITTYYNSQFGYGGVMFDLTPQTDLEITAFDVNLSAQNTTATVSVYYSKGTSFGIESDPQAWALLETVDVRAKGTDNPSSMPLSVSVPTFLAGNTYGIYLELQGVTASNTLRYSTAPSTTYSNADIELVTNCAKGAGGIFGTVFAPREFNGTVYYNTDDKIVPTLTAVNFVAGQTTTIEFRNGTPGARALVGFSLTGAGPTMTQYGAVDLSNPIKRLPIVTLDASGAADFSQTLPAWATGVPVWIQGIDLGGTLVTNGLALTVQ
ncbi:MAG: hypothetical protein MK209_00890 [Planctomycetes bacterium]|nr:hypothetical protein [Planctomycetota bacterium]